MVPPTRPARRGILDQFRGLPWWQIVLAVLPLSLVLIGGLVGGLTGAVGAIGNLAIARSRLSPALKAGLMIGVTVLCYIVVLVIASIIYAIAYSNA